MRWPAGCVVSPVIIAVPIGIITGVVTVIIRRIHGGKSSRAVRSHSKRLSQMEPRELQKIARLTEVDNAVGCGTAGRCNDGDETSTVADDNCKGN